MNINAEPRFLMTFGDKTSDQGEMRICHWIYSNKQIIILTSALLGFVHFPSTSCGFYPSANTTRFLGGLLSGQLAGQLSDHLVPAGDNGAPELSKTAWAIYTR